MKKVASTIIRIAFLSSVLPMACWQVANEEIRAKYLPWVPELLSRLWPGKLPAYFTTSSRPPPSTDPESPSPVNTDKSTLNENHMTLGVTCQPKTKPVEVISTQVYQWVDENGRTRFSDTPPEKSTTETKTTEFSQHKLFSINLDTQEATLPPFIRNRLEAQLTQIYRYLSDELHLEDLQQTELNLKLFDDKSAYDSFQALHAPALGNTSGFYNPQKNIAAVHTAGYSEQAFAVTRHESTHAILTSLFGNIPTWLNEGLAEAFENLTVNGQSRTLTVANSHLMHLREKQQSLPDLKALWSTPPQQWYDRDSTDRYAMSWALTFYLLSDEQRRAFLGKIMNQWLDQPCGAFSSSGFFQDNWPGGLESFESQWHTWLNSRQVTPIHF